MEFDKSRVFTALNADELKVGSKIIFADNLSSLQSRVIDASIVWIGTLESVWGTSNKDRFKVVGSKCFNLAYLISEPEEKKLEWTDLKIGDIVSNNARSYMVTGIDTKGECGSHIYCGTDWITDGELNNWKKVE